MKHDKGSRPRKNHRGSAWSEAPAENDGFVIVGKNPVREALREGRQIDRLDVMKDNRDHVLGDIVAQAKKRGIVVRSVEKQKLNQIARDAGFENTNHQGIAAMMAPFDYVSLDAVLRPEEDQLIVILDHILDPHNFGAIVRSANLCGASAVIFPDRRSASVTAVSMKASAGAMNATAMVKVANLTQAIETLKDAGFWIAAADMDGQPYDKLDWRGKMALVVGSEGAGVSPNVKKHCDFIASIPNYGTVDSFNASVAAGVLLCEAARQRHGGQ
ncbi:23S rRNA (guanosine(2251)-2'-O)-methyltransferase RlmB [Pseudoramibacter porci]|uniref:23S rRNA (Guanosine(2251)-2'-O)-methyltransferase RlmB n=1 Tax=Pseudoramibacter porci TaxID=2606631 RepID=A0A7X2NEX0_9FIRM|nr:23S rRNA (guanosine(2251)-2'-O)-methyltransferase RlmB [Pseudoramibacter porci]MSS18823.1 23S rRNA (guanosine(2251)-2'-O)-methyltransferase RlmB [Pseudoramibacter porci]